MRAAILLRVVAGFMFGAASLQVAAADLLSVYREAQKEDAVFAAARANLSAGQEKLPQGLSGLLPSLTVSGNTLYNDRDLQFRNGTPSTNARFNSNTLSITALRKQLAHPATWRRSNTPTVVEFRSGRSSFRLRW